MLYYIPPDYQDPWEWRIAQNLASGLSQVHTLEGCIGFVLAAGILLLLILLKLLVLALRRLWDTYQSVTNADTAHGNVLKWSALGLLMLCLLAAILAVKWPAFTGIACIVVSASLFVYTLFSEWFAYQASTPEASATLPEHLSIQDIITFTNEHDAAAVGIPLES